MDEYITYGKEIMRKIREALLDYKKSHKLTNEQMSVKCDISLSEYDKIMNVKRHSNHGCSVDTLYKVYINLKIEPNEIFERTYRSVTEKE